MQTDILLVTLNSSYAHTAFGLRYLYANLQEFQSRTRILEYTIAKEPRDIAEQLLMHKPRIIGLGVYIWNAQESLELVTIIKKVSPETLIILGGPEVSHESEGQKICQIADYTIKGEADFLFYEFCKQVLQEEIFPPQKFIAGSLPDVKKIVSPYPHYSDEDIQNRVIYVEVSRGCPYRCEYCLSSLDKAVRSFEMSAFLKDIEELISRGARQFKFIDRTFNLSPTVCTTILQFFLDRIDLGLFLHFEMVPDRLPTEIRELIKKFPAGALQFEIGIQTWNTEVAKLVSRRNDLEKVKENFRFLAEETGVHTHADLIVGLPGEDLESFARGFDILFELRPDEIQVGILKKLKGAPIARHDREWEMSYHDHPPFQILRTKTMDYATLQMMNRFAKYWDLYANSGNFKNFIACMKEKKSGNSFFWEFYKFNEFLSQRFERSFGISLVALVEAAYVYLVEHKGLTTEESKAVLLADYALDRKRTIPVFLREDVSRQMRAQQEIGKTAVPKRQQRHLTKPEICQS